jgi:hypothetical protein
MFYKKDNKKDRVRDMVVGLIPGNTYVCISHEKTINDLRYLPVSSLVAVCRSRFFY